MKSKPIVNVSISKVSGQQEIVSSQGTLHESSASFVNETSSLLWVKDRSRISPVDRILVVHEC